MKTLVVVGETDMALERNAYNPDASDPALSIIPSNVKTISAVFHSLPQEYLRVAFL